MGESEPLATQARNSTAIILDILRIAKKLRKKAEALEKESNEAAAAAAKDLADYLEAAAAEIRGP